MELRSAEGSAIKKQLEEWIKHSDYELECTFGGGSVDATTFFQVAQRLRSKGLKELSQEDRLTIMTPEHHVRFTINGMGVIQQYCRDDILNGKPFIAMKKDSASQDSQVDLDDYSVRVKTRREIPMENNDFRIKEIFGKWPQQKKAFRLIRRWSFEDKGIRYDLSIVRSTKRSLQKNYIWQHKFNDQDLALAPYMYEIEVELIRLEDDTEDLAFKRLIKGIGEVLRGIQKSSILINNIQKTKALSSYQSIVKTDKFIGCAPITLEQQNFIKDIVEGVPNIRTGYNVTDKADGLRCLAFVDGKGELFLIDMAMNVYRTGMSQSSCRESIIDGEFVTKDRENKSIQKFLAFDIYYTTDKKLVSNLPFYSKEDDVNTRYKELVSWMEKFNKDPTPIIKYMTPSIQIQVSMKKYYFAPPGDIPIFKLCKIALDTGHEYNTDGLILTSNSLPLPGYDEERKIVKPGVTFYEQFKWKPSHDNTIDFLVRFEKDPENKKLDRIAIGIAPDTDETIRYKTIRLFVGSQQQRAYNPRDLILNDIKPERLEGKINYRPVPFYPKDFNDPMASICYGIIQVDPATQEEYVATKINNEPIQDKSIIEMAYDPSKPRGWRWIPIRIRHDKTERLQRGEKKGEYGRTLNSEMVANSVWNSIHDPITPHMIKSGSDQQTENEATENLKAIEKRNTLALKYFERKAPVEDVLLVKGLRGFHNGYIKEVLLYGHCLNAGSKLIDIACGEGSDIRRWNDKKVSFVLGIDNAGNNITGNENGTYARYLEIQNKFRLTLPPMVFVIGDTSKRILDGKAGETVQESDILRSIFGEKPSGPIPSMIDRVAASELKEGADSMSCMFALHYFFESKAKLDGLLQNIRETIKVGGYFFGCCFDGESVFDFLEGVDKGKTKTGEEKGSLIWTIRKEYDKDELTNDEESLGQKINVHFISIGKPHDEYLMNFTYFKKCMNENGFSLLNPEELKEIGLVNSTGLFSESYKMGGKSTERFQMSDIVKQFSFFNRWFIFKKKENISRQEQIDETSYAPLVKPLETKKEKPIIQKEVEDEDEEDEETKDAIEALKETKTITPSDVAAKEEQKLLDSLKPLTRTIPVEVGEGAPQSKSYASNEVFQFFSEASLEDKLKIGDKGAGRWLIPSAPFPIEDPEEPGSVYPSLEHYMAGMMYKHGTNKPTLGKSVFGREGTIHQRFTNIRLREQSITEERDKELIKEESTMVKSEITPATFKSNRAEFNPAGFALKKDKLLREAVEQRYKKDARLKKIIEGARKAGKYLLYYTGKTINELGGSRSADGIIRGDNKLGKLYMEFGGYN